ncbi:MAG: cobalamin biosynthesis protein CobD [Cyanobacteria bacterium RI_101]|nr:cobalamin biosynthesis protein CobD [Cyanobacteria bacterium RI_101]
METPLVWLGAVLLDRWLGDPPAWLHPVQVMGWLIDVLTQAGLKGFQPGWPRKLGGALLALTVIGASALGAGLTVTLARNINPYFGLTLEIIGLASCLAGQSLAAAVQAVLDAVNQGDLPLARRRLAYFVGRDTESLNETDILRAALESLAENTVDGVTAPFFYALLGSFLPGVGPLPLAFAYKAASTLDSMVGYRREPYADWGWFSARLEDGLTWLPCRLTVLILALISRRPRQVLALCQRDAPQDPSPNSGWSEGVFAAVLGVQLGGENRYQGEVKRKPFLGEPRRSLTPALVEEGLILSRSALGGFVLLGLLGWALGSLITRF